MADTVGLTTSIARAVGAGNRLALELITLAEAVATAVRRIERVASEVSLTCSVL